MLSGIRFLSGIPLSFLLTGIRYTTIWWYPLSGKRVSGTSLQHGLDSSEGFTLIQLDDEKNKEKDPSGQIAEENEPPLKPKRSDFPDAASVSNVSNIDHDGREEVGNKMFLARKLLLNTLKRHLKLSKTKSIENQQLSVMREDLTLKKL